MSTDNICVINFVHEEDGMFVNGTISTVDGPAKASWKFAREDGESSHHCEVAEEDFDALWDALNEPVFNRHVVRSPDIELDFRANYVVGVMFSIGDEAGRATYLIPSAEQDVVWQMWLKRIAATQRPA